MANFGEQVQKRDPAPKAYLLDIEGTTTPIEFVTKTLFPYAARELGPFLRESLNDPQERLALISDCCLLSDEYEKETGAPEWPARPDPQGAQGYLEWLIELDRKSTALKSIQGRIWEYGYQSGRIKGEVYDDVWPAVRRWKGSGAKVCIYSSGSVLAQRLLFSHLPEGDMTADLDGYFDTTTGPKRDPESYRRIASTLELTPADVLFLSDVQEEVDAAIASGMRAVRIDRGLTEDASGVLASFRSL
ncbi:MAG: acireductone synthase [Armatimonadetes bacterium]|nr:acireductone synthase [Armatimonadota bacterium]